MTPFAPESGKGCHDKSTNFHESQRLQQKIPHPRAKLAQRLRCQVDVEIRKYQRMIPQVGR
jgi:hypothetical protein